MYERLGTVIDELIGLRNMEPPGSAVRDDLNIAINNLANLLARLVAQQHRAYEREHVVPLRPDIANWR